MSVDGVVYRVAAWIEKLLPAPRIFRQRPRRIDIGGQRGPTSNSTNRAIAIEGELKYINTACSSTAGFAHHDHGLKIIRFLPCHSKTGKVLDARKRDMDQ
ncbi:MAG: hypothetical protein VXW49_16130 [Pseudomonadota bacterium]|nr:hypothetical protein [Pseudomonadota bacterium]